VLLLDADRIVKTVMMVLLLLLPAFLRVMSWQWDDEVGCGDAPIE